MKLFKNIALRFAPKAAIVVVGISFAMNSLESKPLVTVDFENRNEGTPYLVEHWGEDGFPLPSWGQGFNQERVFVDGEFPHGDSTRSIRVAYPKAGYGPSETGAQAALMLEPKDEYYISYSLRFSENFSWGGKHHGGKLPGLGSGELCSGGQHCDGTNGFSARMMWRTNGKAVLYLYYMDKPRKYGEDYSMVYPSGDDVVFTPGQWFNIVERVRINSGNNHDGLVQLWVDGKPTLTVEGIRFVNNGDLLDTLFFSTFHGGNDPDWAPREDCYINFDDFKVGATFESVR